MVRDPFSFVFLSALVILQFGIVSVFGACLVEDELKPFRYDCSLCEQKFVIILGTGRSGSSSILGMVDQLDKFDMAGEHNGEMNPLFNLYNTMLGIKKHGGEGTGGLASSWGHSKHVTNEKEFFCWIQSWYVMHSGLQETTTLDVVHGFKEVVRVENIYPRFYFLHNKCTEDSG
jgi:hypothetical protein